MKVVDLLKINQSAMESLSKADIRKGDYKFVALYEEFEHLREKGEKYWYVITHLAEKYKMSESSVKRLVKRLSSEVIL